METDYTSRKPLTPTMEDYLETIFALSEEKRAVRVKDIAKKLGVKMPTVTNMVKTLSDRGFIDYEKYEYLELTDRGATVGKEMQRRHEVLKSFLTDILKIEPERADEEACKMEHGISLSTLDRLIGFMEFIQACPRAGLEWLNNFEDYLKHGPMPNKCLAWMQGLNGFGEKMEKGNDVEKKKENGT